MPRRGESGGHNHERERRYNNNNGHGHGHGPGPQSQGRNWRIDMIPTPGEARIPQENGQDRELIERVNLLRKRYNSYEPYLLKRLDEIKQKGEEILRQDEVAEIEDFIYQFKHVNGDQFFGIDAMESACANILNLLGAHKLNQAPGTSHNDMDVDEEDGAQAPAQAQAQAHNTSHPLPPSPQSLDTDWSYRPDPTPSAPGEPMPLIREPAPVPSQSQPQQQFPDLNSFAEEECFTRRPARGPEGHGVIIPLPPPHYLIGQGQTELRRPPVQHSQSFPPDPIDRIGDQNYHHQSVQGHPRFPHPSQGHQIFPPHEQHVPRFSSPVQNQRFPPPDPRQGQGRSRTYQDDNVIDYGHGGVDYGSSSRVPSVPPHADPYSNPGPGYNHGPDSSDYDDYEYDQRSYYPGPDPGHNEYHNHNQRSRPRPQYPGPAHDPNEYHNRYQRSRSQYSGPSPQPPPGPHFPRQRATSIPPRPRHPAPPQPQGHSLDPRLRPRGPSHAPSISTDAVDPSSTSVVDRERIERMEAIRKRGSENFARNGPKSGRGELIPLGKGPSPQIPGRPADPRREPPAHASSSASAAPVLASNQILAEPPRGKGNARTGASNAEKRKDLEEVKKRVAQKVASIPTPRSKLVDIMKDGAKLYPPVMNSKGKGKGQGQSPVGVAKKRGPRARSSGGHQLPDAPDDGGDSGAEEEEIIARAKGKKQNKKPKDKSTKNAKAPSKKSRKRLIVESESEEEEESERNSTPTPSTSSSNSMPERNRDPDPVHMNSSNSKKRKKKGPDYGQSQGQGQEKEEQQKNKKQKRQEQVPDNSDSASNVSASTSTASSNRTTASSALEGQGNIIGRRDTVVHLGLAKVKIEKDYVPPVVIKVESSSHRQHQGQGQEEEPMEYNGQAEEMSQGQENDNETEMSNFLNCKLEEIDIDEAAVVNEDDVSDSDIFHDMEEGD